MYAGDRIDDEEQQICFADRLLDLPSDLDVHRMLRIVGDSTGVHEPECAPVPIRSREVAIACRAGFLGYNGRVTPDDAVEERGFSDVGAPEERDDGNGDVFHAAASPSRVDECSTSVSPASTSMKSYDG